MFRSFAFASLALCSLAVVHRRLLPPAMEEQRKRRRSAWAVAETQLGMITYEDLLQFRRDNMSINEQVVQYTNDLLETMASSSSLKVEKISLLDVHPELKLLETKLDQLLSR